MDKTPNPTLFVFLIRAPDRKGLGACLGGGGDSSSSILGPPHPAADLLRRRFGGFVAAALPEVGR